MNRLIEYFLCLTAVGIIGFDSFTPVTRAVTIETVLVGNPGNAGEWQSLQNFGGVNYIYGIGKYEVTNVQYVEFLNSVANADTYGLYNPAMDSTTQGGITRIGSSGSYIYSVKPDVVGVGPGGSNYSYANKPVVYISWYDALRFANWLHNGQPNTGTQISATTEDGAYTFTGATTVGSRNSDAAWFLPSENEWYKAAYHKNDGVTGNYWRFPTSSNDLPNNNLPNLDTGNSANSFLATGNTDFPMFDVGSYTLSKSPYGTYDQGGNVLEWTEGLVGSSSRSVRGGSWANAVSTLDASQPLGTSPTFESERSGFRVATVPEPSGICLAVLSAMGLWWWRSCRS